MVAEVELDTATTCTLVCMYMCFYILCVFVYSKIFVIEPAVMNLHAFLKGKHVYSHASKFYLFGVKTAIPNEVSQLES